MTDALLFILALLVGAYLWHLLTRNVPPQARIVLPGHPMHRPDHAREIPWHTPTVPVDATHIAWIMHGEGDLGTVHTLYLQTLESLRREVEESRSPWGPIITHSIELECDIRGRAASRPRRCCTRSLASMRTVTSCGYRTPAHGSLAGATMRKSMRCSPAKCANALQSTRAGRPPRYCPRLCVSPHSSNRG